MTAEPIIIRCMRTVDLPDPPVPSDRDQCVLCQTPVWISHGLLDEIARLGHAGPTRLICLHCEVDEAEDLGLHMITPGQLANLHAAGVTDSDVELTLTALRVLGPNATTEKVHHLIQDVTEDQDGSLKQNFFRALATVRLELLALKHRN